MLEVQFHVSVGHLGKVQADFLRPGQKHVVQGVEEPFVTRYSFGLYAGGYTIEVVPAVTS